MDHANHWPVSWQIKAFACALMFFHASEFLLAVVYMRSELSTRSLLITKPYMMAMAAGLLEFAVEASFFPALKQLQWVSYTGLVLLLSGEVIRKTAMVTAASNFTHDIAREKRQQHQLVTTGIYRYFRHPGYLGWFMWSVATQILLINPVCTVLFTYVSWRFFAERIPFEEWYLRQFFGHQYLQYAQATPSGIPFIP